MSPVSYPFGQWRSAFLANLYRLLEYPSPSGYERRVAGLCEGWFIIHNGFRRVLLEGEYREDLLLVRGEPPYLMLNAHLDTCQTKVEVAEVALSIDRVWVDRKRLVGLPSLHCGFDDKAGIAAIDVLSRVYPGSLKVLLTTEGETGGAGVKAVPADFFSDVLLSITLDRMGAHQLITYRTSRGTSASPEVVKRIIDLTTAAGYPFYQAQGTWADTAVIGEYVPAVNLSIGYHNPHGAGDYLNLAHAEDGMGAALAILEGWPR